MLKLVVPLYYFNYRDQNDSIKVINNKPIIEKEFVFQDSFNIKLKNFDTKELNDYKFNYLSENDIVDLQTCNWVIYFKCNENEYQLCYSRINILLLSFRIAKQSKIGSNIILCENNKEDYQKYWDNWLPALRKKNYPTTEEFSTNDLNEIKNVFNALSNFEMVAPRTKHAVNFLFLAYTSYYWMEVFIILMTTIETLVSPSDERQITKRIIKRVRGIINDPKICSGNKIKDLYDLRSNIVHGRILENNNFEEHKNDLNDLQLIVLTAFQKILSNDFKSIYKNEESKEKFFDLICNNEPS